MLKYLPARRHAGALIVVAGLAMAPGAVQAGADGLEWGLGYKADLISRLDGARRLQGLDHLELTLSVDGDKALGWPGTSAYVQVISNHGGKPALHHDRLPHGLDNIETPYGANTTKVFQAWVQWADGTGRWSTRAGLLDLNAEFYVTETSAMFIHPTFGMAAEIAGTGKNGPSSFPTTSVGLRLKLRPSEHAYLQVIGLDGVPGDPGNPRGTHIQFNRGDGVLWVTEAGMARPAGALGLFKYAVGAWRYTNRFADLVDTDAAGDPSMRVTWGAYVLAESELWRRDERSLAGFLRLGRSDGNTNPFDRALGAGVVWSGLLQAPDEDGQADQLGLALAVERNGAKYRAASGNPLVYEKSLELGYRFRVARGLHLQPFVQYLIGHGAESAQDRAWYGGVRLQVAI
ncbi:MAG: carbohydrate porin [Betaproteobacteria bacterium]|nr:carbohydrate porin [Betaproteobacteria bacterium]